MPSLLPDDFLVAPGRMVVVTVSGAGVSLKKPKAGTLDTCDLRVCEMGVGGDPLEDSAPDLRELPISCSVKTSHLGDGTR